MSTAGEALLLLVPAPSLPPSAADAGVPAPWLPGLALPPALAPLLPAKGVAAAGTSPAARGSPTGLAALLPSCCCRGSYSPGILSKAIALPRPSPTSRSKLSASRTSLASASSPATCTSSPMTSPAFPSAAPPVLPSAPWPRPWLRDVAAASCVTAATTAVMPACSCCRPLAPSTSSPLPPTTSAPSISKSDSSPSSSAPSSSSSKSAPSCSPAAAATAAARRRPDTAPRAPPTKPRRAPARPPASEPSLSCPGDVPPGLLLRGDASALRSLLRAGCLGAMQALNMPRHSQLPASPPRLLPPGMNMSSWWAPAAAVAGSGPPSWAFRSCPDLAPRLIGRARSCTAACPAAWP
mmetsp:Transcript_19251/g.41607  ORF Transcript_19251/g.41607 Transcript_19251/m.41607 type:complete len:352 (-) Transcript_19251:11-1066(-)